MLSDEEAIDFLTNWVSIQFIIDHRLKGSNHEYLLRADIHSGEGHDFWVPLQQISKALDPFIQCFHEIHWDHIRPGWYQFHSVSRPDKGLVARTFSV